MYKRQAFTPEQAKKSGKAIVLIQNGIHPGEIEGKDACMLCLLYTSDAADERSSVDLGGRRIIKKKKRAKLGEE